MRRDPVWTRALKSIEFSEAESRIELEVRNNLIFLTSGGAENRPLLTTKSTSR